MLAERSGSIVEPAWRQLLAWSLFALALVAYPIILGRYASATSPTFDEGMHIAAGYRYWQCGDYAINAEHPPLLKLLAAAPVRHRHIEGFDSACGTAATSNERLLAVGYRLINSESGETILQRARRAAMFFPMLILVTVFLSARAWFGNLAAAIAVVLTVFEPNLTAHGPLVATDMAVAATTILTIFCAERYWRKPSVWRLLMLGVALGCALSSKHTAVLVPPILLLQFATYAWLERESLSKRKLALYAAAWLCACVLGLAILWATYRFRFSALPGPQEGFNIARILQDDERVGTIFGQTVLGVARLHLLPESYLAGLLYVVDNSTRTAFIFGREHETGVWYYFPATLLIKTPLPILLLVLLAISSPGLWKAYPRQLTTVIIPAWFFLVIAMAGKINLGVRHILPVYPFLILLACASAAYYARRSRAAMVLCVGFLVFQCMSYSRSFPNLIAYANEAWGGSTKLRLYLGDSNVDWAQSLYQVRDYAAKHAIQDCWIAWLGGEKPTHAGLPCRLLASPSFLEAADTDLPPLLPEHFSGTIFVSNALTNYDIFPYRYFLQHPPNDLVAGSVLVFHGDFHLPEIAAERHVSRGWWFLNHQQAPQAVEEFAAAEPYVASPGILHSLYGWALEASGRPAEARTRYAQAAADFAGKPAFANSRKASLARAKALSQAQ